MNKKIAFSNPNNSLIDRIEYLEHILNNVVNGMRFLGIDISELEKMPPEQFIMREFSKLKTSHIEPDKNIKVPKYVYLSEGFDPKKCDELNKK